MPRSDPGPLPEGSGPGLFLAATLTTVALFAAVASVRGVNADEGFYLAAGELVGRGHRLYADFFYPQMPYLALAQAGLFAVTGVSLRVARLLSVVPAALLAGVIAVAAARWEGRIAVGALVAVAFATHALALSYLTVVKTYGLSNLCLVAAVLLVAGKPDAWRSVAAGACAALAVGTRLPAAAVAAVLAGRCLLSGARPALAFAAGAAVAGLPALVVALHDPPAFWFDNVGFHSLRREISGFGPIMAQKLGVLGRWLLVPQNLVVWTVAVAGLYLGAARQRLAFGCALAIGAVYLYVTPTYLEYMVQLLPFLILASTPALSALLLRRQLAVAVACVWLVGLALAFRPAEAGSHRAEKIALWRLERVEAVARYLQQRTAPGDAVLSWWEGYPVLAGRPGFTSVGFWQSNVAKKMSPALRRRYHVAAEEEVGKIIEAQAARLLVFPDGVWTGLREVIDRNYRELARFGAIRVLEARSAGVDGHGANA